MPQPANTAPRAADTTADIWVLVADAGRARILKGVHMDGKLEEVEDLLNPGVRLQEHDAVSDRRGSVTQGAAGIGHAFEPRHSQAEISADEFAKKLCKRFEAVREAGKTGRIYLIADPSFLGLLRQHLSSAVRALVVEEIASDLTRRPMADIRQILPARL